MEIMAVVGRFMMGLRAFVVAPPPWTGYFCSLQKLYDFSMINWSESKGIPPGGSGIIEIEIDSW